jgi:hypothetical protein
MPTARKRSLQELNADNPSKPEQPSMLHRIRNMWQFANLYQFILLFGQALKLDDNLDIEVRLQFQSHHFCCRCHPRIMGCLLTGDSP